MSQPWFKFQPQAWRGDQGLRAVSLSARGMWIECLCIMHEAKPYGHLTLNGSPVGDDALARMTGTSVDEVSALMSELRQAGVLSVTGKGVIFSRRMVADRERAAKGRKSAEKRWGQDVEKPNKSPRPNGVSNGNPITENTEVRVKKEELRSSKKACQIPKGFSPDIEWAINRGLPREIAIIEAEKFVSYWQGEGKPKKDWAATWRTWVVKAIEYRQRSPQRQSSQAEHPRLAAKNAAFDEIFGDSDDERRGENTIEGSVLLLSAGRGR